MKKIAISLLLALFTTFNIFAQNEGRISFYTGINKTTLNNASDKAFGDYLPTFKPTVGFSAGYHFTLFKSFPMGFSFQAEHAKMGQNYRGNYQDSTSYYAFSRLNYYRLGMALHFGTNPRRQVALAYSIGANYGFMSSYSDNYELIRYNNDRYHLDIKNNTVSIYDTSTVTGTLKSSIYNNTDLMIFSTLGLDFLISQKLVFGFYGRFDYGMSPIETNADNAINLDTNPTQIMPYQPNQLKVKHRGPASNLSVREVTNNMAYGIYFSLRYRIYNKEKVKFWYKEKSF